MGVGGGAVAGQGSTLRQDNALAKVLGQSLREQFELWQNETTPFF